MKNYMVVALCLATMLTINRQKQPCKIVQRYYQNGKLVATKEYDSFVKDHGCLTSYLINGIEVKADSVVTTLK